MRRSARVALTAAAALAWSAAATSLAHAEDLRGRGSVGANIGGMLWTGGSDLSDGAAPRPHGEVVFGYVWRTHTQFVSHLGFAWNGYNTSYIDGNGVEYKGGWSKLIGRGYQESDLDLERPSIARVGYLTAEIQRNFGIGKYQPHVNVGAGLYSWRVGSTRHVYIDPTSRNKTSGVSPGVNIAIGVENYVSNTVAIDANVAAHYVMSADAARLPAAFNENSHFVELRAGLRWYFTISGATPQLPPIKSPGEGS
jgi:hypothetical protein